MVWWFFRCLADDSHVLVPSFINHQKQNNDFLKCFLNEDFHKPARMRLPLKM